jgi:DMSO reductase anchor subunit
METLELPLVLFTLFTQMAVGMAIFAALRQWAAVEGPSVKARNEWIAILALIGVAVFAAFFHLGKPLGFIRMLANLQTAWLSREILGFGLFGALTAVTFYTVFTKTPNAWLIKITALVGLLAVFSTGMAYASAGLDAIHNILPLVFFLLTVFTLGPAVASYFVDSSAHGMLRSVLGPALLASLVVRFAVPFVWLSSSSVMAQTGQNFITSPLHWLHLAALLAGLFALRGTKNIPTWLPILLLVGELLGRLAFFALMTASGANLGGLY